MFLTQLALAASALASVAYGGTAAVAGGAPERTYEIPTLPWPEPLPPDWVSVKAVGGAKGDGLTDDTLAIRKFTKQPASCL